MSVRRIIASNPALTRFVMSRVSPSVHERRGAAYARRVLRSALERTRAYPAFLTDNGVDPEAASWERFGDLPLTTKRTFIDRYSLADRCVGGRISRTYVIERSSGVSGGCYYWPRLPEQDRDLVSQVDMGFRMYYRIHEVPTLFISTFALGTWVGGVKMATILRDIALSGKYPVTAITPGVNIEEILQIVRDLAPAYEQTVMFGYPPFLKEVLDRGAATGIRWERYNVRLGTTGEGFPEEWRDRVVKMLGRDPDTDLLGIMGGYGAADLGASVAQEYPLTVLVRRLCMHDVQLSRDLFGSESPPDLFQYDPGSAYVERIDDELIFTVDSATPLVRYAIHDLGGVIPYESVTQVLREHGYDPCALMEERGYSRGDVWRLPFLYCYGRADGTVVVGGANVYPENIIAVLAEVGDREILGHKLSVVDGRFRIALEHRAPGLKKNEADEAAKVYHRAIVEGLQRVNSEYRDQYLANRRIADPIVEVHPAGSGPFEADVGRLKRRYTTEERPAAA
ncbi:MAG: phenylacetate--CoA ligase family protein [Coriobacteriia bacterium]|nr:phenylacetate--CoA ligase family protein [Coriobacteriia bacterium]